MAELKIPTNLIVEYYDDNVALEVSDDYAVVASFDEDSVVLQVYEKIKAHDGHPERWWAEREGRISISIEAAKLLGAEVLGRLPNVTTHEEK